MPHRNHNVKKINADKFVVNSTMSAMKSDEKSTYVWHSVCHGVLNAVCDVLGVTRHTKCLNAA